MYAMDKCIVISCAVGGALQHLLSVTVTLFSPSKF